MNRTENMMWAGPLLPAGWDPAPNLKPIEQPPLKRLVSTETFASDRRPAPRKISREPMIWTGPLAPELE